MERKEEIAEICKNLDADTLKLITPLVDELIFIESQLAYLRTLPFTLVKKDDPTKQKATPAYKQYKDLSQTYINALKVVNSMLGIESDTVESPLRLYMEERAKRNVRTESIS